LGGALGAIVGVAAAAAIATLVQWNVIIDLSALLLAISVAGTVGVFFGYYPAAKAARLDPIVALRYE
jgi:putative ABC transport system permease protein